MKGAGVGDEKAFLDFALVYHDKEPVVANFVVIVLVSTPLAGLVLWFLYLWRKDKRQYKKHQNILEFKKEQERNKRS